METCGINYLTQKRASFEGHFLIGWATVSFSVKILPFGATAQRGSGPPPTKVSRPHTMTLKSVGLLWMSDRPFSKTSTGQHTKEVHIHAPRGIRTSNSNKPAAANTCLRLLGHWDWPLKILPRGIICVSGKVQTESIVARPLLKVTLSWISQPKDDQLTELRKPKLNFDSQKQSYNL